MADPVAYVVKMPAAFLPKMLTRRDGDLVYGLM